MFVLCTDNVGVESASIYLLVQNHVITNIRDIKLITVYVFKSFNHCIFLKMIDLTNLHQKILVQ